MHVSANASVLATTPLVSGKSNLLPPGLARRELDLPPGIKNRPAGAAQPPGIANRFSSIAPSTTDPVEPQLGSETDAVATSSLDILV
jgi:hypothetical protein